MIAAWLAEIVLISYRDIKKGASNNVAGLPLPADYLATFAIFGVLGALPDSGKTFAAAVGWGYVAATFLNLVDPTLNKAGQANGTGAASTAPAAPTGTTASGANAPLVPASIPSAVLT